MAKPITYGGAILSISAAAPATYDAAGFAALTYTVCGEATSVGDRGQTYEDVSYNPLAERATVHLKGTSDQPETELEVALDRDDAGQLLMKAASKSDDDYSYKLEYSNGEIDYFQALAYSFVTVGGGANDIRMGTISVRINALDVVEVAAP